jgi:putative glycosyltransferase (TIGR04372 family)
MEFLNNKKRKIKSIFYGFFSKILIIFLTLLRFLRIHIRINELETRAIGHYSTTIECYLLNLENHKNTKNFTINIDIWFRNKIIANYFLYNYWKKYLNVYPPFFKIFFNMIIFEKKFDFLIPYKHWRTHKSFPRDEENILDKNSPIINFNKNEIIKAEKILNATGFDFNQEFFCFSNRDTKFRNDLNAQSSLLIRDYKVSVFNKSLIALSNKKIGAVRMGSLNHDKLSLNNKFIFDYAFSNIKNDFLDFYIFSKAKFAVVGNSGINHIPFMLRKPTLGINLLPYVIKNWNCKFHKLTIFKKIYSNKKNRYLNYKEVFDITIAADIFDNFKIQELELSVVDNTEKEIFDLINEYLLKQNNNWTYSESKKQCQEIINNFFRNVYKIDCKNVSVGYNFAKENIDLFKS